jgi:hypothetical protein
MHRIDRWKLADELNVYQVVLLIAGYDPCDFERKSYAEWPEILKKEVSPYLNAIKNAARSRKFAFTQVTYETSDGQETDWIESLIDIQGLRQWMSSRNFKDGFFFESTSEVDSISDRQGAFYAPKLAAAVRAWNEVTSSPEALNGKTPKKALEIWLRKHAGEYGLTNKDGNPNELGIEEICKVANWKPSGGASPTPTATAKPTQGLPSEGGRVQLNPPYGPPANPPDDDIPF